MFAEQCCNLGIVNTDSNLWLTRRKPAPAALLRIALYGAALVAPLAVVAFVPVAVEQERPGFLELFADNIGLLGFTIVSLQFVLAAGLKWVEWPFGLDIVLRFHRRMAVFASVLLLLHPVLMAVGGETEILTKLWVKWPVQLGRFALLVLISTVVVSLYWRAFRLSFEQWRRFHNALALILLPLGFLHSLFAGDDLKSLAMRAIWFALVTTALVSYTYHRFARPRIEGAAYTVGAIHQEAHDVWTIVLRRADARPVPAYAPGQFHSPDPVSRRPAH
ncbi:MAG TPA: ferric reductase-like transmembrane domain-containing protein [Terriglobales bacterium]|nr:ferric reductase-like transmembrane domain-containing protein [Terriglobales bacterium]